MQAPSQNQILAANRFGMGLRPDDRLMTTPSSQEWLLAQIERPETQSSGFVSLPSAAVNYRLFIEARLAQKQQAQKTNDIVQEARRELRDRFLAELRAKFMHSVVTQQSFIERLVNFWSNHFTVSNQKGIVAGFAGAYEREAIRPHVTGKFLDMLLAVARHPAMLIYLDNINSTGPNSIAGKRRQIGLNENLAREILELHTLGVNGGYSQADVTSFARVLTGWTLAAPLQGGEGTIGRFSFEPRRHEPGAQTIMGKTYPDDGEAQGIAVMRDLAQRPETARHLAFKLARHFLADDPPEATVAALAAAYMNSGGDLGQLYRAMIARPEFWESPLTKIRTGPDLVVAAARHMNLRESEIGWCLQSVRFLGQVPFTASSPAGFPDIKQDLAGPESMLRRIEWAEGMGLRYGQSQNVAQIASLALGPYLKSDSRALIATASSQREALGLLYATPEFQRR